MTFLSNHISQKNNTRLQNFTIKKVFKLKLFKEYQREMSGKEKISNINDRHMAADMYRYVAAIS